mgnify:CR=1 FL=1
MEIIQIIIVLFALFALSRAFLRFKDNKLTKIEFVFWGLVWVVAIVLSFIPGILGFFSKILGIGRGTDLLIYLSIILLFYLIFRLYVKMESIRKDITLLVRKFAIENKDENETKASKSKGKNKLWKKR